MHIRMLEVVLIAMHVHLMDVPNLYIDETSTPGCLLESRPASDGVPLVVDVVKERAVRLLPSRVRSGGNRSYYGRTRRNVDELRRAKTSGVGHEEDVGKLELAGLEPGVLFSSAEKV